LDLDKANAEGKDATLDWNLAYSFLKEYGLKDGSVESVSKLE
jgi:uncharacterized protein (DUF1684 family)